MSGFNVFWRFFFECPRSDWNSLLYKGSAILTEVKTKYGWIAKVRQSVSSWLNFILTALVWTKRSSVEWKSYGFLFFFFFGLPLTSNALNYTFLSSESKTKWFVGQWTLKWTKFWKWKKYLCSLTACWSCPGVREHPRAGYPCHGLKENAGRDLGMVTPWKAYRCVVSP